MRRNGRRRGNEKREASEVGKRKKCAEGSDIQTRREKSNSLPQERNASIGRRRRILSKREEKGAEHSERGNFVLESLVQPNERRWGMDVSQEGGGRRGKMDAEKGE